MQNIAFDKVDFDCTHCARDPTTEYGKIVA